METLLPYIQIVLAIFLSAGILLQQSEAGMGAVFGGGDDSGGIHRTRRGFELTVFRATIVFAILFVISALLPVFLS